MKKTIKTFALMYLYALLSPASAEDTLELNTTFIKGNKELPQVLYVVPWKDVKNSKKEEQRLVLHSLFGDLFDPIQPNQYDLFLAK